MNFQLFDVSCKKLLQKFIGLVTYFLSKYYSYFNASNCLFLCYESLIGYLTKEVNVLPVSATDECILVSIVMLNVLLDRKGPQFRKMTRLTCTVCILYCVLERLLYSYCFFQTCSLNKSIISKHLILFCYYFVHEFEDFP